MSATFLCRMALPTLFLFSAFSPASMLYQAIVSPTPKPGEFGSINQALQRAPQDQSPYTIYIKNGVYHERIDIERPNVHWLGQSRDGTIIAADTAAGYLKPDGKKWGTYGSSTVKINAPDFTAKSLTIRNDFDFPANAAKKDSDSSKLKDTQAVALLLAEHSDRAGFYDVSLIGYQDTLYAQAGRSYFSKSRISGTVDFIFGGGTALFDDSDIVARARHDIQPPLGYMTAPSTDIQQPYGLVFLNSRLIKENASVPANSYGLGRPWHPTTTFADGRYANPKAIGETVYINCTMDNHIYGWDKMSGKDRQGNKIWFYPDKDARFMEFHSQGQGAANNAGRHQLSPQDAKNYTLDQMFGNWQPGIAASVTRKIQGVVTVSQMHFPAHILVVDQYGKKIQGHTDTQGHYELSAASLIPPLLVSASEQKPEQCLWNNQPRGMCMGALLPEWPEQGPAVANINPLSDQLLSSVAEHAGYLGPQQMILQGKYPLAVSATHYAQALAQFHTAFDPALKTLGITQPNVDPVTYPATDQAAFARLIALIHHNRNYDTTTGQVTTTALTDPAFTPVMVKDRHDQLMAFDLTQAQRAQQAIHTAKTRIFIVGDSTASIYEPQVYPRMGWGQVFQQEIKSGAVQVVDAARSGRSSRDYANEGWFRQIRDLVKPGDYVLIQMGHNDEKCDGSKATRGAADVANLCTYPNSAGNQRQYPAGHPDMSFQTSLERYIQFAKDHHAHPVLLTPTTRVQDAQGKTAFPVVHSHLIKQNTQQGYAFVGDYSATIRHTAQVNHVPLLDIEQATIAMANQLGEQHWKEDWLAVDPANYPYYADGKTGTAQKPDTTHLQQRGAQAIAHLVHTAIAQDPQLKTLAHLLN